MRLVIGLVFYLAAVSAYAEKRVALVIGNANYSTLTPLTGPAYDAADVESVLRALEYKIVPPPAGKQQSVNLTRREMLNQLGALVEEAKDAKLVLLYYSGHGVEVNNKNFLLPVDMEGKDSVSLSNEGLSLELILENLASALPPTSSAVVVLDACRDAGTARGNKGMVSISERSGFFVAFATASGDTAEDVGTNKRNSPYTEAFLSEIKTGQALPISNFFIRVKNRVEANTGQQPNNILGLKDDSISLLPGAVHAQGTSASPSVTEALANIPKPGPLPSDARGPIDIGNDRLRDPISGLVWMRSDNGRNFDWYEAKDFCEGRRMRLPTIQELDAIIDPNAKTSCGSYSCMVPSEFKLSSNWFWSSTKAGSNEAKALYLNEGTSYEEDLESDRGGRVLCVGQR